MAAMALPTGPGVTFLFTDIEGSTRLEQAVGSSAWAGIVARHDRLLRDAIESNGGVVVKTEGDAFFAAFERPEAATRAAADAQRAIATEPWPEMCQLKVRMGLHLGEGRLRHGTSEGEPQDYVGIDVNYAARITAAGNGGQVVLSHALVEALDRDHVATNGAGANGVSIADEGLRAVKDFEEPRRLHRLVVAGAADDTRPLRTVEFPSNLPGEVTELVGRDDEIDSLRALLDSTRILTLTGPGGSGKTRLALGLAQSVRDRFPHGTWFIDLAAVREAGMLEPAIATTLGLRDSADRSMAEALRAHLRERSTLLLLDNLEQLLPQGAEVVSSIARGAPDVRCLVTSRELLRIGGERGHPVPPLDADAGIRLFEARATALRPDLVLHGETRDVIRQICERLSGLPLAIELAAARVRLLSPALILERLANSLDLAGGSRDVPERQRTLRGAMAWSHDLLSDPERALFRRLGVFAGGFTGELAAPVADPDGALGLDLLEGLESLADKSLLRIEPAGSDGVATEPRFDLHPLLREYALERLDESGERAEVEGRHAAAIAELAESTGRRIQSATGSAATARLDQEQHNVRAALDWSLRTGETTLGLRIMSAIWRWFQQRGRLEEGRTALTQLMANAAGDLRLRIAALAAEGGLAYWSDDFEAARRAYEARLAFAEESGDSLLRADAHYDLGFMFMIGQDPGRLRQHELAAVDLYQEVGHQDGLVRARQALVLAEFLTGDYERALELETENLAAFRAAGSEYQIADSMTFHAGVYYRFGDAMTAWEFVKDGMRWFAANDNQSGNARALCMAAIVALTYGDAELGARLAGATYEIVRTKGVMLAPVRVLHLPEPRDLAIDRLGAERAEELLAEGAAMPLDEIIELALAAPAPRATEGGTERPAGAAGH
jgi:predicted ATPase/class 3 adenylate cyclase